MGNRLFVGNLSYSISSDELRAEFSKYGTVTDVKILMDRETGRSRGFGFITLSTDQEAANAMSVLNGVMIGGRTINVNEARERNFSGGNPNGGNRSYRPSSPISPPPSPPMNEEGGRGRHHGSRRRRNDDGYGGSDY
jgi:RNA recognition motif-containing protein